MSDSGPPSPRPVVIVGAGGFGREVLDVVEAMTDHQIRTEGAASLRFVGFIDDGPEHLERLEVRGARLLSGFTDPEVAGAGFVVAVGNPLVRRTLVERAMAAGLRPVSLRHPTATEGAANTLCPGLVMCANSSITTNITMGVHVQVNLNATIGHDAVLGDYVTVYPGANVSGGVTLGDRVEIGTGACLIQGVTVGAGTVVGAGAVVTRDLPADVVAVGSPARFVGSVD